MPSPLLQLRIPQDLADWLEAKYPSRGEVAEYVRQLLTAEQMKEAVAPLVPDWTYEGIRINLPEAREMEATYEKAVASVTEPKPKARRKRVVTPVSPGAAESELKPVSVPARCNRGACTGTIKPNGHCMICNQRPRIQDW